MMTSHTSQEYVLSSLIANPRLNFSLFVSTFTSPRVFFFFLFILQLCFSYKGKMKGYISFRISYTDESGSDRRSWRKYSVVTIPDEKWNSLCLNVYDEILHDTYLKVDLRFKAYVEIISVTRDAGVDLYIDDVFIWRDPVMGRVFHTLIAIVLFLFFKTHFKYFIFYLFKYKDCFLLPSLVITYSKM